MNINLQQLQPFVTQFQPFVTLVKDIVTIVSTVVAATIAILGLRTWRKQLRGKTEYELARRLLRSVYKVRDAMQSVRNPFVSSGETAQAMKEAEIQIEAFDQANPEHQAQGQGAVYQRRWKPVIEALSELDAETLEAEVTWGHGITECVQPLHRQAGLLSAHVQEFLDGFRPSSYQMTNDERRKARQVMYGLGGESDQFAMEVEEAVKKIEEYLKPYLKL